MNLNEHIAAIRRELRLASPSQASAFYACCAERFFPLYSEFSRVESWGDNSIVRAGLDRAWNSAESGSLDRGIAQATLDELLNQTPHADDFGSVETTFAQGACQLVSAALESAAGITDERANPVESLFDILRVAHCVETTGFLDLGGDPRAASVLDDFQRGATFIAEAAFQNEDLHELLTANLIDGKLLSGLRARAGRNRYRAACLLPSQNAATRGRLRRE